MEKVILLGACMLLSGCGSLDKFTANAASLFEKNPDMWPVGLQKPVPMGPSGFLLDLPEKESHTPSHKGVLLRDGEEISMGEQKNIRQGIDISNELNYVTQHSFEDQNNVKNELSGKELKKNYKSNNKNSSDIVDLRFQTSTPLAIPNKDGTETVINPNGTVKTVHNDDDLEMSFHQGISEDTHLEKTNKANTH